MKRRTKKLTIKTAKELFRREFGFSPKEFKIETQNERVDIYEVPMGRFLVTIQNDWSKEDGLFSIIIDSREGDYITNFYNAETLEEDYDAEYKLRLEIAEDRLISAGKINEWGKIEWK